jgi:hypothetical protein
MDDPRPPTRVDLARFIPDPRTLRAFEQLFKVVPGEFNNITQVIDGLSTQIAIGQSLSEQITAENQQLSQSIDSLSILRASEPANSAKLDYIDFTENPPHTDKPRRVVWNGSDDTLNIHHLDGVVQQVGLETYVRARNNTGSTIPNGTVVGFSGATGGDVLCAPYLADGSTTVESFIGLTTEAIQNGEIGRVTVFGVVRGLDTSPFAVGDLLYASSTVAGGLTVTKPTAPAFAIPVGIVTADDATNGQILVRPIIEQTKRYGKLLKTSDQVPAAINTAYAITFDSIVNANGVSIGTPSSRVVCAASGLYTFAASFQLSSGSASVKNVWLWFRKNGTNIANSALKVSLESGSAVNTQYRSIFETMNAGDYIELMWAADSTNVTLDNIGATAFAPAAPAVVLTVDQIQQ